MKKFQHAPRTLKWLRRSNVLYFFLAWNAFALTMYKLYSENDDDTEEKKEWKKMTGGQKYLSMTTDPNKEVTVINVRGLSVQKRQTTFGEYIKPEEKED